MPLCPRCRQEAQSDLPPGEEAIVLLGDFAQSVHQSDRWKIPYIGEDFLPPEYDDEVPTKTCDRCGMEFGENEETLDLPEEIYDFNR